MANCKDTEYGNCIRTQQCNNECLGCDHKDTSIVVLEVTANCEKTAMQCDYCSQILTEPKTDC